jgi:hypothetical protein
MTTSIGGMWGIDNCVGESACQLHGCTHTCSTNGWYMSYPNFQECGSTNCGLNSSLPRSSATCGGVLNPASACVEGPYYAHIFECGPNPGQYTASGWCNPGGTHELIACGTIALLTALANGSNPYTYGHVYARLYV